MTIKEANKIAKKVFKNNNSVEEGILISLLSFEYLKRYNIEEKDFIRSLKNSLKILGKTDE